MWTYIKNKESRAIGSIFVINAILFSNWVVRIPDVKQALHISDAQLGFALLAPPLGIILFTPIITISMNRLGTGKVSIISAFLLCIVITLLGTPQNYTQLIFILFFFGAINGTMDISMNGVVSAIEKSQDRIIMSTTHGFWSLGAMLASFAGGYIASFGINYPTHFIAVSILSFLLILPIYSIVWPLKDFSESKLKLVWPGSTLMILILIVFLVFMVEGGIADWTALFYEEILESPKKYLGFGFGAFSAAMALGRFAGDQMMRQYSSKGILISSLLIAFLGVLLFAQAYSIWVCTLAMVLTGLACSVLVPLVFREAGASKVIAPSLGLALVSSLGYAGFLIGPPMIGFIAEAYGLSYSFVFLSVMLLLGALFALFLRSE